MDLPKILTVKGRLGLRISCMAAFLFFQPLCPYLVAQWKNLHWWIAERAYSQVFREPLDGLPGCEDVDCLLRIATYPCAGGG
jgi:hypothetical protein